MADAAVSIDPISGFGTAWAVRGGILAAAVVDAVSSGLPEDECLRHDADRLGHAVAGHVDHCLGLYGTAFSTPAWKEELALMASTRAAVDGHGRRRTSPTGSTVPARTPAGALTRANVATWSPPWPGGRRR